MMSYPSLNQSYRLSILLLCLCTHSLFGQYQVNGDAVQITPECYVLTQDGPFSSGSVWYLNKVDISKSFDVYTDIFLGNKDANGADGIAFVLQPVSTSLGEAGLDLGYGGIVPSVAVEFDTYQNVDRADPAYDHVAIMKEGVGFHNTTANMAGPVRIIPGVDNAEDGQIHSVRINWNAVSQELSVYVDCVLRTTANRDLVKDVFGGNPEVFWGFTGATGGLSNIHNFCLKYVSFTEELVDTTICKGESATLNGGTGSGNTFSWSPATGLNSTVIPNPIASPDVTTTYYLEVTDFCGFKRYDTVTVSVSEPVVEAGPDSSVCEGRLIRLQGSGNGSPQWSPTVSLINPNTFTPFAFLNQSRTYTLTVTDSIGCTASDTVSIQFNPLPNIGLTPDTAICAGDSATLSAGGGIQYSWSPATGLSDPTIPSPTASPGTSTTYGVVVTDANGCVNTENMRLTVNALPVANAGDDQEICDGTTASLSASGGSSYEWSPTPFLSDPTIQNPIASPLITTIYSVEVTDGNGCTDSDSIQITVLPTPIANAGTDTSYCSGESVRLLASGGVSYDWTPAIDLDNPASATPTVFTEESRWYQVRVRDVNECEDIDSLFISVFELPSVLVPPDTNICAGDSISLLAAGGLSYAWTPSVGLSNPNIASPMASPATSTDYLVSALDANGCENTADISVVVNPLPEADAGEDQAICPGGSALLAASGGISYSWKPENLLSDPTGQNPTATPRDTSAFILTVTDENGCQDTDLVLVNVLQNPDADAGQDTSYCEGESIRLEATGGVFYEWSPASGLDDPTIFDPLLGEANEGWYAVTVRDLNDCTDTDSVFITLQPKPELDAGTDQSICIGQQAQLVATGVGQFSWSPGFLLSDAGIATPTTSPTQSQQFTLTITDNNGCSNQDSTVVTVNALPVITVSENQNICEDDEVSISASGASVYRWIPTEGLSNNDQATILASPSQSTTYTVIGIDQFGCVDSASLSISVTPKPIADVIGFLEVCPDEEFELLATGGDTYLWSTGAQAVSLSTSIQNTTTFWVIPFQNGCAGDTAAVEVSLFNNLPLAAFSLDTDRAYFPAEITLTNESINAVSFEWDMGDGTTYVNSDPLHTYSTPGTYTVQLTATGDNGCTDISLPQIIEILNSGLFTPNAFSPNGDGDNDLYLISAGALAAFQFTIFDRWGRKVLESQDPEFRWDGTLNGQPVPEGNYVFSLKGTTLEGKSIDRMGSILLVR
ncbi:MAG: PKD domain-containing protein [Bacteroidota bacterium]